MKLEIEEDTLIVSLFFDGWEKKPIAKALIDLAEIQRKYNEIVDHNQLADPEWLAKSGLL
jgi:hypothetical protein